MLLDAGELSPMDSRTFTPRNAAIQPNDSKKPFEWIVDYIRQFTPSARKPALDYALITHYHDDHFGAWYPDAPWSRSGKFRLSGIIGVLESLPVQCLVDRGAPTYNYPYDLRRYSGKHSGEIAIDSTMRHYFSCLEEMKGRGLKIDSMRVGSDRQFKLLYNAVAYPQFRVRNIKRNQWVWTGKDSTAQVMFPPVDASNPSTFPDENSLSLAITIQYGPFVYYTGGDNAGNVFPGDKPWRDTETAIANAVGAVDVATLDHHGNRDAVNAKMIQTLQPSVWIGQTWSADHPGHEVLVRLTSAYVRKRPADLFATNMLEANRLVIGPLIDRSYKSLQGHIVVRVQPGGNSYHVIILEDTPERKVKAVFGPYPSYIKQSIK